MPDLPFADWQFWVVTAISAAVVGFGLWRVARSIIRSIRGKKETRVSLTINREEPK
ncbi:MAG: hypothetical protein Kow0022_18300 [Phycisphaerales bacterium]